MRKLSLNEIEMVRGAGHFNLAMRFLQSVTNMVKSSPTATGAGLGATANSTYYVYNDANPTMGGVIRSGITGVGGGIVASKAPNSYIGTFVGSSITGFLDKATSGNTKVGDNYLRVD